MSHRSHRATLAATVAASLAAASAGLLAGAGPAAAAAPRAQAVGRFVDGSAGGNPIQQIADLHDARATNPGTVTDQNPLDITLGGQAPIPLSGKLQGPGGGVFTVGAANQVAKALSNGYSYGAAGAVANSGGASLGGNNSAFPASAKVNLSAAAIPSPGSLPLPGAGSAAALGGLTAEIGGISALASTPVGFAQPGSTAYSIATAKVTLASPALGAFVRTLANALKAPSLPTGTLPVPGLPPACTIAQQALPPLTIGGGVVTISPTDGAITIDLKALLSSLGANINQLPANTDLLSYLLTYLSSPDGLGKGIQAAVGDTLVNQKAKFVQCLAELPAPLNGLVKQVSDALTAGQAQLKTAIDDGIQKLTAAGGANPFAPLTNALKQALQIGVNVQPHAASHGYTSPLAATPDQATPVVAGQTIVRALEIDLGGGQLSVALANAAAGPSEIEAAAAPPAAPPATTHVPQGAPNTEIPTGVPAGQGPVGRGTPTLPLVLLVLAVLMAGAGAVAWRVRPNRH